MATVVKHSFTKDNPYTMGKADLLRYIQEIVSKYNLRLYGRICGSGDVSDHVVFRLVGMKENHVYDIDYIQKRVVSTWDFDDQSDAQISLYELVEDEELHGYMSELVDMVAEHDRVIFAGIGGEILYDVTHAYISWEVSKYERAFSKDLTFYEKQHCAKVKPHPLTDEEKA